MPCSGFCYGPGFLGKWREHVTAFYFALGFANERGVLENALISGLADAADSIDVALSELRLGLATEPVPQLGRLGPRRLLRS